MNVNDPVCRNCGSDELGTVERGSEWRHATFARGGRGWEVEEYGDRVGDDDWTTTGVVCVNCNTEAEVEEGEDWSTVVKRVITTRGAYNRAHPVRRWWVIQVRPGRPETTRKRMFDGRDAREAFAAASIGLEGWRPLQLWNPDGPTYWLWPVGTKRPPAPERKVA